MNRLLVALALVASTATPAAAYDPDRPDEGRVDAPTRAVVQIPPGLYRVTEVYAGDVVSRTGDLTTYGTAVEHRETDTYARVLETIGTGERSAFDGSAFNGRGSLSNGQLLAGTYYEDFVRDGARFVPVSVVFFQDDSELVRRSRAARVTSPALPLAVAPSSSRPVIAPPPGPRAPPSVAVAPDPPAIAIGLDPTGGSAVLDSLEVARAARYAFRVNARGIAAHVVLHAWQLVDGVNDATNAPGWHGASDFLIGTWLRLPRPDTSWELTLRVRLRSADGGPLFEREGRARVWVRSPAVVE